MAVGWIRFHYIFHPGMSVEDYNIEDQNVADLAGDAAFICMDWLFHESPQTPSHLALHVFPGIHVWWAGKLHFLLAKVS